MIERNEATHSISSMRPEVMDYPMHPDDGTSAIGKWRRRLPLYQRGLALARRMLFGGGRRESRPVHPMLNGPG